MRDRLIQHDYLIEVDESLKERWYTELWILFPKTAVSVKYECYFDSVRLNSNGSININELFPHGSIILTPWKHTDEGKVFLE